MKVKLKIINGSRPIAVSMPEVEMAVPPAKGDMIEIITDGKTSTAMVVHRLWTAINRQPLVILTIHLNASDLPPLFKYRTPADDHCAGIRMDVIFRDNSSTVYRDNDSTVTQVLDNKAFDRLFMGENDETVEELTEAPTLL